MVKLGNFLFQYRNVLFPVLYITLFIPAPRFLTDPMVAFGSGLVLLVLGQLIRMLTIGLSYIIRGGKNRRVYAEGLVTDGIFSHCRNPMYVGNVVVILGLAIMSNSIVSVFGLFPLFILFYQAIILAEENYLRDKFGLQFQDYAQVVPRWIPTLSGISNTVGSMEFHWKRVVLKEYNTTFLLTITASVLLTRAMFWGHGNPPETFLYFFLLLAAPQLLVYLILKVSKKRRWLVPD